MDTMLNFPTWGKKMPKVLIIGGGAAGMMSAVISAMNGCEVHLFEQNEKLGKKLYITGKGRCNFTNACDMETLFANVITNEKFMYSAFNGYNNYDVIDFFESLGVKTKIERGNRVFPQSDHSSDIILGLSRKMKELDVKIHLRSKVLELLLEDEVVKGIMLDNQTIFNGDRIIVATGGLSYASTGATGDGYRFANGAKHNVAEQRPSLVPMEVAEDYIKELQGLSLKNVTLSIFDQDKKCFDAFGEMMFTHFGITGPLVLTASAMIGDLLTKHSLKATIDLKSALSLEQLDNRILREMEAGKNKQFKNIIGGLLPSTLQKVILLQGIINPDKKVNEVTREERLKFVEYIKNFPMTITKLRGYNEAVITNGGVITKEINPKTMESKLVKGLYFVGEVLDVDALTGGFNLQIAWSSAYAAAMNVQKEEER